MMTGEGLKKSAQVLSVKRALESKTRGGEAELKRYIGIARHGEIWGESRVANRRGAFWLRNLKKQQQQTEREKENMREGGETSTSVGATLRLPFKTQGEESGESDQSAFYELLA